MQDAEVYRSTSGTCALYIRTYAIKLSDKSTQRPRTRRTRASHHRRRCDRSVQKLVQTAVAPWLARWGLGKKSEAKQRVDILWGAASDEEAESGLARGLLHLALHSRCRLHQRFTHRRRLGLRHRYPLHHRFRFRPGRVHFHVRTSNRKKDCVRTKVRRVRRRSACVLTYALALQLCNSVKD